MTKRIAVLLIIALFASVFGSPLQIENVKAPAGGVVWTVPSGPTPTLQAAVAIAAPNDEIHVNPGHFEALLGPLIIPQNDLWIIGAPSSLGPIPTIDLKGFSIVVMGPNVFIYGLDIMDSVGGPVGIQLVPPSTNVMIMNNIITGIAPGTIGIQVHTQNNTIALNTMSFWGTCIDLTAGSIGNIVKGNTLNPFYNVGIQVSGFAAFNQIYWNNIMLLGPPELFDANPPGSPPNFFDDTSGGGPGWMKGNFEASWVNPAPYPVPPLINGYMDFFPLLAPIAMLSGDANLDGQVSLTDLVLLARGYAKVWCTFGWDPRVDFAAPYGNIGLTDLVTLAVNYKKTL